MNQMKNLRKLALLVLVLASVLTLAACKSTDKTPYGDLSDDVYVTVGGITVTEKELYDQLRLQGASILATMVDETIFADDLTTVRALLLGGDEDANDYLDETINTAIHGFSDEEALEDLYTDSPERWVRNIQRFADSLYLLDNSSSVTNTIAALQNLPGKYAGYSSIPVLLNNYILRVTQRNYAKGILETEVADEDNANYISEQNLVTYYKSNKEGRYDVDALVVRFINLNEANSALYLTSIKSDSKGLWYRVPDIRISNPLNPGYVDLTDESQTGFGHVKTILSDLGLLGKLGAGYTDRSQISVLDYENYYKKYTISTSRTTGREDVALTTAQVKEEFVKIYNILNPASEVEIALDGTIIGKAGSTFDATLTYDEVNNLNTSLRSHIYTTLVSEASMEDPEDVAEGKPYSSRVQTFGTSRYLVFKISDEKVSEEGILIEDPEDAEKEIFASTPAATAIKDEMFDIILNGKLTSDYISSKVTELYEDLDLNIYDKVVRIFYEQQYGYEGSTDNKSGDVVASIDDNDITVEAFYNRLEKSYGINLSLDLAFNKLLLESEEYTIPEDDRETFQTQFEDIISQFSADNFASSGYPASMGREKFLLLAFGATTNTEAVNQLYVYPELRQQYIKDIEAHYSVTGYSVYQKLADLAKLHYDHFKSINVSHLLIYFDQDGNGSPDNPQEYLDTLSPAGVQEVKDGLVELVETIYEIVGQYKGFAEGLTAIANEFNNSGRIERGSRIAPIDYQIELKWSEYRQLGFYLKFETISSAITNTSNLITGSSVLDQVFYDRAMALHAQLDDIEDDDAKFPLLDLYDSVITEAALDDVQSSFGWHLILATGQGSKTSAIFNEVEDEDGKYVTEDGLLNAYNSTSETLTASQIEYYLTESESDEGVVLPSSLQIAVSSYLAPVLSRYQGTFMQRELVFMLLEDAVFASSTGAARFQAVRAINVNQLNEYLLSSTGYFDQNYNNLYGTWFTVLRSGL